eukprot:CAMPEP_0114579366 /NCGR_PEP_ID=MMETSP0125-20121206/3755_1 /TAXON_ID=485358 ORGANISM="Aristerostoma sp., Strain ATCC 50986" /NCGR_SAMPLE_ID=MMETSP0125 /ASSEMBLY_ACC=CAM_ASM_000245 /LENGTH=143 /DNA_ID=CAMNT_0001770063 /DNA_START=318 /DNA_END=749 /DNA_ORIENTATION=+
MMRSSGMKRSTQGSFMRNSTTKLDSKKDENDLKTTQQKVKEYQRVFVELTIKAVELRTKETAKKLGVKDISKIPVPAVDIESIESKDDRERKIDNFCKEFQTMIDESAESIGLKKDQLVVERMDLQDVKEYFVELENKNYSLY